MIWSGDFRTVWAVEFFGAQVVTFYQTLIENNRGNDYIIATKIRLNLPLDKFLFLHYTQASTDSEQFVVRFDVAR